MNHSLPVNQVTQYFRYIKVMRSIELPPVKWEDCKVGDVVFCKVRGSCVTHKVYAVDNEKGCLIGNNKGHMNGWTKNVYGLAHKIDQSLKTKKA